MCRFFIHLSIAAFAAAIASMYGIPGEQAMLFPSTAVATRCLHFLAAQGTPIDNVHGARIIDLVFRDGDSSHKRPVSLKTIISAVVFPKAGFKHAKTFWQHSGDGVSSRRAEFCYKAFMEGYLTPRDDAGRDESSSNRISRGPRRYQRKESLDLKCRKTPASTYENTDVAIDISLEKQDYAHFVEERFGRNLDLSLAVHAKLAIRRRIAGSLAADVDLTESIKVTEKMESIRKVQGFSEKCVYLHPTGMSSIFNTHRIMLQTRGHLKSIMFG